MPRRVRWIIGIVAVVVGGPLLWLGIHAFVAYDALMNAQADVRSLQIAISSNQFQALPYIYTDMKSNTGTAAAATSDPLWVASESLPVAGPNLRAVREIAQSVNSLVVNGVGPIASQAKGFDLGQFRPEKGQIDMAKVESLVPAVDSAYRGVHAAQASANAIDTTHTLGPVTTAVTAFRQVLDTGMTEVGTVRTIIRQVPPALGSTGARDYLVVLGTNAQDRANGGAAAALSLVRIDDGALTIVRTESAASLESGASSGSAADAASLPPFASASGATVAAAEHTPDFPATAAALSAAWTSRYHDKVDVVVSIDSTGLGYLATAAGRVPVAPGKTVSATSFAHYLDVTEARTASPTELASTQTTALAGVLGKVIAGSGSTPTYLAAANSLLGEKRLQLWSSDPKLQSFVATTPFSGILPASNSTVTSYGVFFNDATSAPVSPYLTAKATLTPVLCTAPTQKTSKLVVSLRSSQPSGSLTEDVLVYGPVDFRLGDSSLTGATLVSSHSATIGGRSVDVFRVRIDAGRSASLSVQHTLGGPTPSQVVEVRSSPRWKVTQIRFTPCS